MKITITMIHSVADKVRSLGFLSFSTICTTNVTK